MEIKRLNIKLKANPKRVILRYLELSDETRIKRIISDVLSLSEDRIDKLLGDTKTEFKNRHYNLNRMLMSNFNKIKKHLPAGSNLTKSRKQLLGAYFSMEYSIEAASLFNPSIVPHPNQSDLQDGSMRFVMSLRATGEGHISSVEFRSGIINAAGEVQIDKVNRKTELPEIEEKQIFSKSFVVERAEVINDFNKELIDNLPENFTTKELTSLKKQSISSVSIGALTELLLSNYNLKFNDKRSIGGRVIFPYSKNEIAGIEDVRFVKFSDDGLSHYYGTYTAYNGYSIVPQIIETEDFINFQIRTLHGNAVKNKGMALFPRKVNGKYAMITREDSESLFIALSDNLHVWNDSKLIHVPKEPWEYLQIGNCGSPIETTKGWLLPLHGVGPLRKYVISACLLDLNDPSKVIGWLKEPLISPDKNEREGYVPNVVYSCGSLVHNDRLVIPYAMSDSFTGFALVDLEELLNELIK